MQNMDVNCFYPKIMEDAGMARFFITLSILLVFASELFASHEENLRFREMSFVGAGGIEVKMTNLHGVPVIEVKYGGKKTIIEKRYLDGVSSVRQSSVKLLTREVGPDRVVPKKIHRFWLQFSYGPYYQHGKNIEGQEVVVWPVIRLRFENGDFQSSTVCFPSGEFKNQWRYRTISPDGVDEPGDYFEESVKSPWD